MSLIPLIQRTLNSLLKLGDMTNTANLKRLLREHVTTAYPLAEAYQKSYTDTVEAIHAAMSPGWKAWLGARRKQEFMAQVVHYYLVDFAQVKGWLPEGTELTTFKNTAAAQYQALLQESKSLFQAAALPPFTEDELAGIVTVQASPSVTQLVLERLCSFQIRLPAAEALAFLQHQELLGKGIVFFLRHHPEVATHLQDLQTTGLWDTVQNVEKELATLKQAGVATQIRVEDEFKAYDTQTFRLVGEAVVLLRQRAVKPTEACHAWLMAGSAVFTLGEMGRARQLLEEALQLAQNDAEAAMVHFNLFQVYLREDTTNYNAVAFHHLQTAMSLDAQYHFYDARKYQLQRLLGAGGMGCAFVGQELVFQREVVIKWFWQKFTTVQEVQQVFQEASLMWRIPREYVPAPLDVSLHGDSACLITEYLPEAIDGESWLKLHGPLNVKEAMSVALQLARGLQAAHQQGIWHLDLKPANVLLYRERSELFAKIIDFGLSRLAQPLMSQVRRSQKQSSQLGFRLAGTWDYAAPEQRGMKKYGPLSAKSDVYGLGKTLMRLCTGKFPQDCRERDMPVELREVVFDCIEEDPAQRPDSTAVIAQLQGVAQQREAEARRLQEQREREEAERQRQAAEVAHQQQLQEQQEREEAERQRQAEEVARQQQLREQQEREEAERQRLAEEVARQQQLQEQQEREEAERQRQAEEVARQQQLREQQEREEAERQRQAEESQNHILWVDDRPSNNLSARQTFEQIGIRVTLALSTKQALKILEETKFTAVISDMARPEGPREGYTLLDTMRKNGYQTPLFFYAGATTPKHQRETLEHGGQGCTDNSQELFEMVTKVLNKDTRPQQVNHPPIIQQLQKSLGQELPQLAAVNVDYKGYQLNANQQVEELSLSDMELTEIPREVWQLTQLQVLLLGRNQLTQLPSEMGQLTQLRELDLKDNQLTQLPSEIGQLTQLRWLRLTTNYLTQLPIEIGQLTQLRKLSLDNNQLTQLPKEIGQLTQLRELGLTDNQLTQLPSEIGQLTQMRVLWLKGNRLTQLPEEIGQLTQLEWLWLEDNPLPVPPPKVVQQGMQAVIKYFQGKGQVKSAEAGTRPRLESESKIIQRLQKFLGQELPQLEEVKIHSTGYQLNADQQVVGLGLYQMGLKEIPREVWQLTQLQVLWLMGNQLTQLPPEIGQLTQLQILGLGHNHLTQLPPEIGRLTQLQKLGLLFNQLTQLPPEIGQLTQLQELYLENNPLQVPPPEVIQQGTQAVIEYLQEKGQAKGAEPDDQKDTRPRPVGDLTIIQQLQESLGRKLEVKVDSTGYQLNAHQQVVGLSLYYLNLTEIPREVWQLTQLLVLGLGDNQLIQLPSEIGQLTQLQGLYLESNQLTQLPSEIGQLMQLQKLELGNNHLTQLPPEIGRLMQLQFLRLTGNHLTQLPKEIGLLRQLQFLGLRGNQLTHLPSEMGQLTQLQMLKLENNQLTQLPSEMGQLTQLQELYLDNNPLQVPPPEVIQQSTQAVIEYLQEKCQAEITQKQEAACQQQLREQQEREEAERQRLAEEEVASQQQLQEQQERDEVERQRQQAKEAERQQQLREQQERDEVERQRQEEATRQLQLREQQEREEAERQRQEEATRQQQLREQQEREEAECQRQAAEVARQQQLREQQERDEVERQRQAKEAERQQQLREQQEREEAERQRQAKEAERQRLAEVERQKQVGDLTIIQQLQESLKQELLPLDEIKLDSKGYQLNAEKQVVSLALCQMNLTEIPKMVWQLTQLQFLGLRGNQLTQLPKEIGQLTRLRKLQLEKNQLTQLPPEIGRLKELQELQLTTNQLTQLPPKIRQLTQLQKLGLWGNQLIHLPKEIGLLKQLQILDVGNNQLTRLPKEIGLLTQLQKLGVGNNKLTELPSEIGLLTQLRELQLTTNQLTQLPPEIGQLTQLQGLYLDNNPLQVPPPKVIQQGTPAVIKYFQKKWWWW